MAIVQEILAKLLVKDEATGPLGQIAAKAGGLLGTFDKIGGSLAHIAGIGAAVGGALSFADAIHDTNEYIKRVKSVRDLTGAAAEQADFLFVKARQAGVGFETMERVMFSLSRRAGAFESVMDNMSGKTVPSMAARFMRMGIDLRKGPTSAIEQMSKQVKGGRLDVNRLMSEFRIPPDAVNDFKEFLSTLDMKKLAEMQKKGLLLGNKDIETFASIEGIQNRIAASFNRIKVLAGREILPIIEKILSKFEEKLPDWISGAQRFGKFLNEHLDTAIFLAEKFVKIMAANKIVSFLTGGTGIIDLVKHAPGLGKGLMEGLSKAFPKLARAGAAVGGTVARATTVAGGIGKGLLGGAGGILGGVEGAIGPVAGALGTFASSMTVLLPVLAGVAAAGFIAYQAFKAIQDNVDGVKDRLLALWDSIKARFELIWESVEPLIEGIAKIFGPLSPLSLFFGKETANSIADAGDALDFFLHVIQTIVSILGDVGKKIAEPIMQGIQFITDALMKFFKWITDIANKILDFVPGGKGISLGDTIKTAFMQDPMVKTWMSAWEKTAKQTNERIARNKKAEEAAKTTDKRMETSTTKPPSPSYDFRGSRFDITQKFAEGFDPDRFAVAFASDLASLGEQKTQSGFSPLYSVR